MGLGSDVAILFKEKNKLQVHAGRITRIRVKKQGKSWMDYTRDINLTDMRENVKRDKDQVVIQCFYYRHGARNTNKFTFDCEDPMEVGPDMIIGLVNMTFSGSSAIYVADAASMELMRKGQRGEKFF